MVWVLLFLLLLMVVVVVVLGSVCVKIHSLKSQLLLYQFNVSPDYPGLISRLWKELLQINKKKRSIQRKRTQERFAPEILRREYPNAK